MTDANMRRATLHQGLLLLEATTGLRHDLRNRLASVRNATFYLRRKVESAAPALWSGDNRVPTFFELIDSELTSADDIITSTTPSVLAAEPQAAELDVAALARELIPELPAPGGVNILAPEPTPGGVVADPLELQIGLRCLLENAIDATAATNGTIRITCTQTDGVMLISVIDDGPGFGDGPRERWLRPFATSKSGRMGLGLNIARRVATRAGGALLLTDGAGRGAAVTISLPIAGDHPGEHHEQPATAPGR